ncbi:hypothetical protein [Maricaulis sp. CAU 1757]
MSQKDKSPAPNGEKCDIREDAGASSSQSVALPDQPEGEEKEPRPSAFKFEQGEQADTLVPKFKDDKNLERLAATFAVADDDAVTALMQTLAGTTEAQIAAGRLSPLNGMSGLVHDLAPRDAAESMLCCQMVVVHMQIMECIRRASIDGQSLKARDIHLRHAERHMRIFTQQLDALNKHRGKGQQKVTVEHVTVNEGGQAVVGSVR